MKIEISRKKLSGVLSKMSKTIDFMPTIPALACIKLDATENGIYLTGSNTAVSVKYHLSVDDEDFIVNVKEPGSALLKYKELHSIVRNCDADVLKISRKEDSSIVRLNGVKSKFKLNSMNIDDFPRISFDKKDSFVSFKSDELINAINMTSFAASTKETQVNICGVRFQSFENGVRFIATDRFRVAQADLTLEHDSDFGFTIDTNSLNAILIYFKDVANIDMHPNERDVIFCADNFIIKVQTVCGGFPDISRFINATNYVYKANANVKDLLAVINRAAILAADDKVIKLHLSTDDVKIYTNDSELGTFEESAEEILNLVSHEENQPPLDLATSLRNISDALKTSHSENIIINFTGDKTPILITDESDNIKRTQVVVPYALRSSN